MYCRSIDIFHNNKKQRSEDIFHNNKKQRSEDIFHNNKKQRSEDIFHNNKKQLSEIYPLSQVAKYRPVFETLLLLLILRHRLRSNNLWMVGVDWSSDSFIEQQLILAWATAQSLQGDNSSQTCPQRASPDSQPLRKMCPIWLKRSLSNSQRSKNPPSTTICAPLTNAARSEARNSATRATSSGSQVRPKGVRWAIASN